MWYEGLGKKKIDLKKPIFAHPVENKKLIYILLPQQEKNSYTRIGFQWFNLEDGSFNCSVHWKTPEEAMEAYQHEHKIYNGRITVTEV